MQAMFPFGFHLAAAASLAGRFPRSTSVLAREAGPMGPLSGPLHPYCLVQDIVNALNFCLPDVVDPVERVIGRVR